MLFSRGTCTFISITLIVLSRSGAVQFAHKYQLTFASECYLQLNVTSNTVFTRFREPEFCKLDAMSSISEQSTITDELRNTNEPKNISPQTFTNFTCIYKHSHIPRLQIPQTLIQYTGTNFCLSRICNLTRTENLRLVFSANNALRIRSFLRQLSSGEHCLSRESQH